MKVLFPLKSLPGLSCDHKQVLDELSVLAADKSEGRSKAILFSYQQHPVKHNTVAGPVTWRAAPIMRLSLFKPIVPAPDKSKVIGGGYLASRLLPRRPRLRYHDRAGAITQAGNCPPDDVGAVEGLGGVGLAGIAAAKHRGVKTIIAADLLALQDRAGEEHGCHAWTGPSAACAQKGWVRGLASCVEVFGAREAGL
ncbi:hypothetical protein JHW43_007629 [Diplocarpon mali]|nr:hypothetical protein JHW43_007629 [Diplocarpon mali]